MNQRNEQGNAALLLGILLALAVAVILFLDSCGAINPLGGQDRRAQQIAAEGQADALRTQAAAEAERIRTEAAAQAQIARAEADAERAATRQMERDAASQRALDMLPALLTVLAVIAALVIGGVLGLFIIRQPRTAAQPQPQPPQIVVVHLPASQWPEQLDYPTLRQIAANAQRRGAGQVTIYRGGTE